MAKRMTKAQVEGFFARLQADTPEPEGELDWHNPFTLLVAVVLSAQATDVGVNKATARLFPIADTPQAMLDLGEEGVRDKIKTIGLFNAKAKNVIALSQLLIARHAGEVPRDRDAFDTHLFRVANRTGMAPGKTPLAVELGLLKRIPKPYLRHAHHWLILHGRYVCKARKPDCAACTVREFCNFKEKTG
jgi:endonuclease-3